MYHLQCAIYFLSMCDSACFTAPQNPNCLCFPLSSSTNISAPWECEKCKKRSQHRRSTRNNKICFTLLILHTQITFPFTPSFHWGCTAWAISSQTPLLSLPMPYRISAPMSIAFARAALTNQPTCSSASDRHKVCDPPTRLHAFW